MHGMRILLSWRRFSDGRPVHRIDGGAWRGFCLMLLIACSQVGCRDAGKPSADKPCNLVLITLDTLRPDHLGCYGYAPAQTPNLDGFAASSLRFDFAITPSNNTLPSHAAMLIGKYPQHFGVPRNSFKVPPEHETLATILKARGYATAAFVSASVLESKMGLHRGFDVYDEAFDTQELDQSQRRASATTPAVVSWLKQRTDQPFFLWAHYFDAHYPYTPPPPFDKLYEPEYQGPADGSIEFLCSISGVKGFPKRPTTPDDYRKLIGLYDGEIAFLDKHLGPVFEILNQPRHRERTMVIVVADHGESLTEHGYYFDHGEYAYQPSMHVPMMMRLPGHDSSRIPARSGEPVETIDLFPTALARLGVPVPTDIDGVDLTPLFEGGAGWSRKLCLGESSRPWEVERMGGNVWPNLGKSQFVIDYPWKLILTPYKRQSEIYRLDTDPGELRNLAARYIDLGNRLAVQLQRWRETARPVFTAQDIENMRRLRSLGYIDSQ